MPPFRAFAFLLFPAVAAASFTVADPALADQAVAMVLNLAVDVTGVTGDNGNFGIFCHVSEQGKVKDNALDGHAKGVLIHDNVNGTYVGHFQGSVRVDMIRSPAARFYDFAKLDTYYCELDMQADGIGGQSTYPVIRGSLPKRSVAESLHNALTQPGLLVPAKP